MQQTTHAILDRAHAMTLADYPLEKCPGARLDIFRRRVDYAFLTFEWTRDDGMHADAVRYELATIGILV